MMQVVGEVHFSSKNTRAYMTVERAPVGLDRHALILNEFLDLCHDRAALFRIGNCKRFIE